jgi:hypothetical protein
MSRANFLRSLDSGRAVRYSDRPAESAGPRLGADFQDASASARPILAGGARNGETATSSRRSPERGGSRVPGRRGRRWHPRAWRSPRVEEGGQLHISNFRRNIWRPAAADANLPGLRIHDLRHVAVALWIAAGASPKEVAASGQLRARPLRPPVPEADTALRAGWTACSARRRNTDGTRSPRTRTGHPSLIRLGCPELGGFSGAPPGTRPSVPSRLREAVSRAVSGVRATPPRVPVMVS